MLALGRRDQLAHVLVAAVTQQGDRVGVAVHDPLEELLAVLVGGSVPFAQPRTSLSSTASCA